MKKLIFALLVTVMSLTMIAGLEAQAATDGYTWIDEYQTAGKKVMFFKKDRAMFTNYGYSGVDVILGNWVMPIAKGNVLLPGENMAVPAPGFGSFGQLYYNNTDQNWLIPKTAETAHAAIHIDANGQVYQIDNATFKFTIPDANPELLYDVWWDEVEGKVKYTGGANLVQKENVDKQLTYADLGTTYLWLTKEAVDAEKAEGITFVDANLIYKDASGKYTNAAEGNTAVKNDYKGHVVKPGEGMVAIEWLDNSNYNNAEYIQAFYTLVNGQDNVAQLISHDTLGPVITGQKTGIVELAEDDNIDLVTGVTAKDQGKLLVFGDEVDTTVTYVIKQYNKSTGLFDTIVPELIKETGQRFQVSYSSTDSLNITTTVKFEIKIVPVYTPIFSGVANKIVNMGDKINLLDGVTAVDGYGADITSSIKVSKGNLDVNNPKPGIYEVLYMVTSGFNGTGFKTATFTVLDTEKPTAFGPAEKVEIEKGTEFDLLSVVYGSDNYGSVMESVVEDNWFDSEIEGVYDIEVHVTDASGNRTKVFYTVEVIPVGTDDLSRIEDLEEKLEEANTTIDDLENYIDEEIISSKNTMNSKDTSIENQLEGQIEDLQTKLDEKSQQSMILTIIVAVLAVAGVALPFATKKH
jgi:hypothetical protein